jgi:DMSO reductase family type II enzyme heme b subunit
VPSEPDDPLWAQAAPATVPLNPQQTVVPRLKEAGAKQIGVRGLYDAQRLALLLEWQDAHKDVDLGTVLRYRDAVAVQFPEDPTQPTPNSVRRRPSPGF